MVSGQPGVLVQDELPWNFRVSFSGWMSGPLRHVGRQAGQASRWVWALLGAPLARLGKCREGGCRGATSHTPRGNSRHSLGSVQGVGVFLGNGFNGIIIWWIPQNISRKEKEKKGDGEGSS